MWHTALPLRLAILTPTIRMIRLGGLSGLTYPLRWEILDQMHVPGGRNPLPGTGA